MPKACQYHRFLFKKRNVNGGANKIALNIGCINARSICNKVSAVLELLSDNEVDVCFLTESWLKVSDKAKFAEIREHGFDIFSAPRKGRGGGVAFLFNSNHMNLKRNNVNTFKSFEVLEAIIKEQSGIIRLSVIYRTTQTSSRKKYAETRQTLFFQEFSDYLDSIRTKVGRPIICGDFNFHVEDDNDSAANRFKGLYTGKGFTQHNSFPTHGNSILDLVLTCDAICDQIAIKDLHVINESPSDHSLVCFNVPAIVNEIKTNGTTTSEKDIRMLSKIDIEEFKKDIIHQMPKANQLNSLDHAVDSYNSILSSILDKHAPVKTVSFREGKNPWWSAKCQAARSTRRAAERKYKKDKKLNSPNVNESHLKYTEAQVNAAIIIDKERNNYYQSKLSSAVGDSKATYKVVNRLLDKEYGVNKLPNGDNDTAIANSLKNFFHSKISSIYSDITDDLKNTQVHTENVLPQPETAPMNINYFKIMTSDLVADVIKEMGKKSCELDPIPTWLFTTFLQELLPIVTLIVNLSLQSGVFPVKLKSALVRATLKKNNLDSDELSNYRPISNLSFLSKVLEKCVYKQLTDHLTSTDLFAKFQSGYRKWHSCDTAVLKIQNDTLLMIDGKSHVVLMLLDLSAAFDTINHKILISKLQKLYGFNGLILQWIKSYITDRSFRVSVNSKYSDSCLLEIGVPQGSILGPLLFILYTKELESIAEKYNFSIHLYADDSQIYFSFDPRTNNTEGNLSILKACFSEIRQWMSTNFLKMNDDKTEIMELHGFQPVAPLRTSFSLDDQVECKVVPSLSAKNLGFYFDSKMNLDEQITKVAQKCYINLRNIGRLGGKLSFALKVQLVHSMVLSILDNGNASYGGLTATQLNTLQKVQNASVRFIYGLYGKQRQKHISPYLKELHFLPVYYRIRFKIAAMVFKSLNNIGPDYISSMISISTEKIHDIRRNEDCFLLKIPTAPRYNKTNGAFSLSAPETWNALPYGIRSSTDLTVFKKALKTHYFRQAFKESEEAYDDVQLIF